MGEYRPDRCAGRGRLTVLVEVDALDLGLLGDAPTDREADREGEQRGQDAGPQDPERREHLVVSDPKPPP